MRFPEAEREETYSHSHCRSFFQNTSPQTEIWKEDQDDPEKSEEIESIDPIHNVVRQQHQTAEKMNEDHVEKD